MSCELTQAYVDSYVDGELDLIRSLEIERHLEDCAVCSRVYHDREALRTAISSASLYYTAPAAVRQRVRSSIRQSGQAAPAPRVMPWRWLSLAASLAFVVLFAWGLSRLWLTPPGDEALAQQVVSSHVRSLMANHLTDVTSTDQHTVKPWFNGRLDFSPPVSDFASQGFPLVGGRLDYVDNRPVAALVYQRRQHIINLFIWPSTGGSNVATSQVTQQGYHAFHWTQSGMMYWAVSDLNSDELQQFVKLVQGQGGS